MLGPFIALSMEFRLGKLNEDALSDRAPHARYMLGKKDAEPTRFAEAAKRYAGVDLYDMTLTNELAAELFERGMFDPVAINAALETSRWFALPADIPSWRKVWEKEALADDVVEAAVADMEAKFAARHFLKQGEILHVFGLRLTLAEQGIVDGDPAAILVQLKKYVDDLVTAGTLPSHERSFGDDFTGYEGLGFSNRGSAEFREALKYLLERQHQVQQRNYPEEARELLDEMKSDHNLFWRRINYTNTPDTKYARTPILSFVDPAGFVDAMGQLPNDQQKGVLHALHSRYDGGQLAKDLAPERAWVSEVRDILLDKAANATPIAAARIRNVVAWTIGAALKNIEEAEAQAAAEVAKAATTVAAASPVQTE